MVALLAVIGALAAAHLATAANGTYSWCQYPKAQGQQLTGCPNGTLYVSQTDPQAQYGSIQAAVESLPSDDSSAHILIGPGNYHEVVNVTRKAPLTLLGITSDPSDWSKNQVHIWNSSYINQTSQTAGQDNADAVVLTISPNRNASLVGSGPLGAPLQPDFGNVDFRAYNLDVANRATVNGIEIKTQDTGPSAALFVAYSNASFYGCSFFSYQDTLYVGRNGSAFFYGGEVRGSTDYLYGFGTAWFESTTLASRAAGGGITAWKGSSQWYGPNTYGAYINNGTIIQAVDAEKNLTGQVALGRPWNNQSTTIYQNTYMSDIVRPDGFIIWSASDPRVFPNVTHYAEYNSYGPGYNATARNTSIETILSADQAKQYSLTSVFGGRPSWIDYGTAQGLA